MSSCAVETNGLILARFGIIRNLQNNQDNIKLEKDNKRCNGVVNTLSVFGLIALLYNFDQCSFYAETR